MLRQVLPIPIAIVIECDNQIVDGFGFRRYWVESASVPWNRRLAVETEHNGDLPDFRIILEPPNAALEAGSVSSALIARCRAGATLRKRKTCCI